MQKNRVIVLVVLGLMILLSACGPASQPETEAEETGGAEPTPTLAPSPTTATETAKAADEADAAETQNGAEAIITEDMITTESGLHYLILEEGTGEQAEPGSIVAVHYTGTLEDGTQFDSSAGRSPIQFFLGQGRVIPGWDEGIALLKAGSKAKFVIPPELGYGERPDDQKLFREIRRLEQEQLTTYDGRPKAHSNQSIADALNNLGFRNLRGVPFSRKTVFQVRRSPAYLATMATEKSA